MQLIDWILVIAPILLVLGVATYTKRYVKSVADFLAAGRCARRYLLANARGESDSGLANTIKGFEIILVSGFVVSFWEKISIPVMLLIGISGFVIYRFRETRALTLAQFFEMRYSRRFRLFMGTLCFISGILNYGVFPAISARFFIYFLALPNSVRIAGFDVSTMALLMASYLICTLYLVIAGGQVTAMVTDCLEGILSHAIYIVIAIAVFFVVDWQQVVHVMSSTGPGKSQIDPFDAKDVQNFNIWFVLMTLVNYAYTRMALQNKQGFNAAAKSPHESRMGDVLGNWRMYARTLMILLLGVCALTYLKHPDFIAQSGSMRTEIAAISDGYLRDQMSVPIALRHLLPTGIKGLFCAMMIMGLFAGDSGHMHSWGSIFIQDVWMPITKRNISPREHIWLLRASVTFVALFAFCFSMVFTQTQYIALWWAVTSGVFTSAAGAAIIGGLYWKRGTSAGAWAGALTGATISLAGIAASGTTWKRIVDAIEPTFGLDLPSKFWFNGLQVALIAAGATTGVYVIVSLFTSRQPFDLDRMLHRGKYAVDAQGASAPTANLTLRDRFRMRNILRFDHNFTFADKLVAGGIFWWAMFMLILHVGISIWNVFFGRWPINWWANYQLITSIVIPFAIAICTLVWFGIGGIKDMKLLFQDLKTMTRDARDDGRVPEKPPAIAPEAEVRGKRRPDPVGVTP